MIEKISFIYAYRYEGDMNLELLLDPTMAGTFVLRESSFVLTIIEHLNLWG